MQICLEKTVNRGFEEINCSIKLQHVLQDLHDCLTNTKDAISISKILENFTNNTLDDTYNLKTKDKMILNRIINYSLYQCFKNSKYVYRGTKTEELDNMLKYDTVGTGGGDYNFVALSLLPNVALFFTRLGDNMDFKKPDRVIIQFNKNKINKDIIFQGYHYKEYKDSKIINEPQGFKRLDEAEIRLHKNTKYDNRIKQLIFIGNLSEKQKQYYIKKYSKIAPVVFLNDKDFILDEKIDFKVLGYKR